MSGELKLTVSRIKATEELTERITEGNLLLQIGIRNDEELRVAKNESQKWNDYNVRLLKKLFNTTEFSDDYYPKGGVVFGGLPLQEKIGNYEREIKRQIGYLESVIGQLGLIEELDDLSVKNNAKQYSNRVFIVHGHDNEMKQTVARFIDKLDLTPIILHEQANEGLTIIEKFEAYSDVGFAIVLLSPDDLCESKIVVEKHLNKLKDDHSIKNILSVFKHTSRQNVVFELGYFIGKLGRMSTCAIFKEGTVLPSDYQGVLYIEYNENEAWKLQLAKEMKATGLDIDLNILAG